jgi:hypothetical protein
MAAPASTLAPDAIARLSTCCPWLNVSVALRFALSYPWDPAEWAEVREHIPWLLAEQSRIRRAGWFN